MSIITWKEEFFNESKDFEFMPNEDVILQGIKKYEGAKKENLNNHNVIKIENSYRIIDGEDNSFDFDADSCGLCAHHFGRDEDEEVNECITCPLFLANNNTSCCDKNSAYLEFYDNGKVSPMIKALNNALKYIENEKIK